MVISLLPHPGARGVVSGARKHRSTALHADHMDLDRAAGRSHVAVEIGHGEALAGRMAIGAGGDEADAPLAHPDRLEARGIRILGGDLQCHQLALRRLIALLERGLAADEIALVEGGETVQPAHPWSIGPGELPRPYAEALLHAQRVE